jgi:hypothetical protein
MSTLGPRLTLKRPDDTDPFLTQDFVDNYNKLDAAPGIHVCTSTTKPSWASAQAGRMIFMTDWKCLQYWDGSAWQNERAATGLFAGGAIFDATLSKNSVTTYNIISFTTPRSCSLAVFMNATLSCDSRFTQDIYGRVVYDGGDVLLGAYSDAMRFTGNSSDTSADMKLTMPIVAIVNVSAGAHTLGTKITVGSYNTSVVLRGIKSVAVLGVYASNQIL